LCSSIPPLIFAVIELGLHILIWIYVLDRSTKPDYLCCNVVPSISRYFKLSLSEFELVQSDQMDI
jgi:hypothetical protein